MSKHTVSEKKKQKKKTNKSLLIPSIVISCDQQLWRSSFSLIQTYSLF